MHSHDGNVPVARRMGRPAPRLAASAHDDGSAAAAVHHLQRTVGNAAVAAFLARDAAVAARRRSDVTPVRAAGLWRAAGLAVQRTPDVPGMSKAAEKKATPLLAGSAVDKQKAIDLVFAQLRRHGRVGVPLGKLVGKKVHYDASVSGEGLTSTDYDGKGRPKKCTVSMGDDAFASLPWLYSSIIHELRHAEQRLAVTQAKLASSEMREAESYTVEILRSKESGVFSDAAQMEDLWIRLHDTYWVNIADPKEKKKLLARVKRARKVAEKATGKALTFTP
jgi:hypothetical protein